MFLDFDKFIPKWENESGSGGGGDGDSSELQKNNKRESILSSEISDVTLDVVGSGGGGGGVGSGSGGGGGSVKERPNPFRVEEKSPFEGLEYALQILEDMTSRLNTSFYLRKLLHLLLD